MNIRNFTMAICLIALVSACKHDGTAFTVIDTTTPVLCGDDPMEESQPELVPVLRKAQPTTTRRNQESAKPAVQAAKPKVATPAPYKAGDKIYVETDGAQGRVWGYVTMQGDRGTGTIHDWDENTWAVTVVRQGDELFAIDQNSRQYVFKLKQK